MTVELTLYAIVCICTGAIATLVAALAWRRRKVPGGASLAMLMSMLALWSFGSALENGATDVGGKLFWAKVCYIGILSSPVLFFAFALEYCRLDRWLTQRNILLLFAVPLLAFILVATNEWHGLIWSSIAPSTAGHNLLVTGRGPLFWLVVLGYSYSLMLAAAVLILRAAVRLPANYRRQTWLILASVAIPWVVNIIYVAQIGLAANLDLTPIALVASGVLIALNIFHFHLLDLAPIARAKLIEHMADGMIALDMQGRIVDVNPAAEQQFGLRHAAVIGKPAGAVFAEWPALVEHIGVDGKADIEIHVADGQQRCLQLNSAPLTDSRGRRSGHIIVIHDDTLHRQAENRLRRQNAYLTALQQTGMELVAQLDLPSLLENIVRRAGLLVGTESGYLDLVDPESHKLKPQVGTGVLRESLKHQVQPGEGMAGRVWQTGQPCVINDYDRWADRIGGFSYGTLQSVVGVPLRIGKEVVGVLGLGHPAGSNRTFSDDEVDLLIQFASLAAIAIENARLYAQVQRDKHYLESLLWNIPTATSIVDMEGRIVSWNPAAETLFGYSAEEAVGQDADLLIAATGKLQEEARTFTRRTFEGQQVHAVTQRTAKDGTPIEVELRAIPIVVNDRPLGAFAIYHDITSLQRARQAAESAARAKSEFLANMSHELRTPLNAILGFSNLLARDKNLPADQQENLAIIARSGEHLLDLINDVLDMAKLESGRLVLHNTIFDLRRMLAELVEMFHQRATAKDITLTLTCAPEAPRTIFADNRKLRQVLINLLGNAVKFTDSGGVVLSVTCTQEQEGCRLRFIVQDTGTGIRAEDIDVIFEPFVQAGSTLATRDGTGLGLPISREIARLMGGDLTASSPGIPGEGSIFCLDIPLRETDGTEPEAAMTAPTLPQPEPGEYSVARGDVEIAWHMLPPDWADEIRAAAIAADTYRLQMLAGELTHTWPQMAAALTAWIEQFDYAAIITATEPVPPAAGRYGATPT